MQSVLRCAAPDPRAFSAGARWASGSGITMTTWRSSRLSGRDVEQDGEARTSLMLVVGGRILFRAGERQWVGEAGGLHVLHGGEDLRWAITDGAHGVRVDFAPAHLPVHLRRRGPGASRLLPQTPVCRALAAALTEGAGVMERAPELVPHLCRGIEGLALALLAECEPAPVQGPADLRDRIVAHIEQHLGDQDLNPGSIADAFGVSLRWVHQCFNAGGVPLARYIRNRRLDLVARALREDARLPRGGQLAGRYGFSGREQLARGFRARFGVTPAAYYSLVIDKAPLPDAADAEAEELAG